MTTPLDSIEDGTPSKAPYLPPARSTAIGASEPLSADVAVDLVPSLPNASVGNFTTVGSRPATTHPDIAAPPASPFIPAAVAVTPAPAEPVTFDAKKMVESQKRINTDPAYGALPTGTEASREAANELRAKAQRVRQRNKRVGWFVGVAFLGGVAAAGWFGYQAYHDEQDQAAIERAENAESDEPAPVDAASPLGQQAEVIEALDDVNSGATASAGALLGAVDDARAVVGETSDGIVTPARPSGLTVGDVLPGIVTTVGERRPDTTGRETWVVGVDEFSQGDPAAFIRFVRRLTSMPQLSPNAAILAELPVVAADEIVISLERSGDALQRAIVTGVSVDIRIDARL